LQHSKAELDELVGLCLTAVPLLDEGPPRAELIGELTMRNQVSIVRSHYSKEIDYVANHGGTATDAYVWERRLGLSIIDELIALVAFIGAVLLLIQIY
jgi:hypothetical protein